ncbi:MAG: sugar ABC transporter permease, partial [Treponemataceae bacterium]
MKAIAGISRKYRKHAFAYILILPTVLYLLFFQLYPLLETIRLSFTDTHLVRNTANFVGLDNFKTLFYEDEHFWNIVVNSVIFVLVPIITQFLVAIPAALILNSKLAGRGLWRGLVMVPWVMPMVVVGLMLKWLLDFHYGLVNYDLKALGLISQSINWFGDEKWVFFTLISASTWKGFAYPTVMTLA